MPKPIQRVAPSRFEWWHGQAAYLSDMAADGREPIVEVMAVAKRGAPDFVAEILGIEEDGPVLVRHRRYLADGIPMQLAISYVPWPIAAGTPMVNDNPGPGGIYARLEDAGYQLDRFNEEITARRASPHEIKCLELSDGVPVIQLIRTALDATNVAVEVCYTVMAADRWQLRYTLPARP